MSNFQFRIPLLIFAIGLTCYACKKDSDPKKEELISFETQIPEDFAGYDVGGYLTPEGTTAKLSQSGGRLEFHFREGLMRIGLNQNGRFVSSGGGTYTCTSDCSSGCDVVSMGGEVGCSSCPKGETAACTGSWSGDDPEQFIKEGAGFIDLYQGISLIDKPDFESMETLTSAPWDVMIQVDGVQEQLDQFILDLWGDQEIGEVATQNVLVNLFGTKGYLKVPAETAARINAIEGEPSCNCSSGSNDCTLEEIETEAKVMVGYRCISSSCTSCDMILSEK
ncbi:MAG: hypothetical protein JXQ90_10195 [Cyclobacteriaceae bacterium]